MIVIIFAVLGLCAGSFINALVWRIHSQSDIYDQIEKIKKSKKTIDKTSTKKLEVEIKQLSILKGRSMCIECRHELGFWDLIPVFSWLSLRGKCRYCHKPVSAQYPLVESLTALLFVSIYLFSPFSLQGLSLQTAIFIAWLCLTVILVALFVYDLKWMIFPNLLLNILIGITVFIAVLSVAAGLQDWWSPLVGGVVVSGFLWGLNRVSSGKWMGDGDAPLGLAIGLALGWKLGILALFGSFYVGMVIVLPALLSKKKKSTSKVPYGPFIIISCFIALFWGQQIIDWYLRVLLNV